MNQMQRRPFQPIPRQVVARLPGPQQSISAQDLNDMVLPEEWTMYDTQVYSANTIAPASAAVNFANFASPTVFFQSRTIGNGTEALTNMTVPNFVDNPFKAFGLGVEVHCDIDATSAAGIATASAFVETVVMYSALRLKFGGDAKLIVPLSDLPAGGGVVYGVRTDTRAAGANQLSGSASNGEISVNARGYFEQPILFKQGPAGAFTCDIVTLGNTTHGALARIQGLAALTGELQALIRVKFWGYRGKNLLPGTSANG